MASKDANDTRRGERAVTDLSQHRLDQRKAGQKPVCGSPLANSKDPDAPNHGKLCKRPAGAGTDHPGYGTCSMHAGRMPSAKQTAARERAKETVDTMRDDMRFYGVHIEISFEEALLEELQRSVGIVRWIEGKLSQWGDVDTWDSSETKLPPLMAEHRAFRSVTIADSEYAAWMRQYLLERKHLAAIAKDGIAAGIAKSMVLIYQQQADVMNSVILRTLAELGVEQGDDRLPQILPRIVREEVAKRRTA